MNLSAEQRRTFTRLADELIPRSATMPAAGEVDVAGPLLDGVAASAPLLVAPLADLLDALGGQPARDAISRLQDRDAAAFELLLTVVAGAYYTSPDVWARLGYHGQRALPLERDDDLDDLVRPVLQRGRPRRG